MFQSRFFINFKTIAEDARIPGWPGTPSVAISEVDSRQLLVDMVQRVLLEGCDPQKSLDQLESEMKAILAKY